MYAQGTESQWSLPGPVRRPGPARSRCRGWRSIREPLPCPRQLHFETAGPGSLSVSPPLAEPGPARESWSKVGIPAPSAGQGADPKSGTRGCSHVAGGLTPRPAGVCHVSPRAQHPAQKSRALPALGLPMATEGGPSQLAADLQEPRPSRTNRIIAIVPPKTGLVRSGCAAGQKGSQECVAHGLHKRLIDASCYCHCRPFTDENMEAQRG